MESRLHIPVLGDDDILPLLDMRELVPLMEEFLRARLHGQIVAPPRHSVEFHPYGRLVFTTGGIAAPGRALAGFRVYNTFATNDGEANQIVAVWNSADGSLLGLLVGRALGEWRTGALGGVAIRVMSRPDARSCAVVGTGRQARTQLLAASACRNLAEVRVYGREPGRRRMFTAELAMLTGTAVRPVESVREAVEGADIVLCATGSATPVLDAAWLAPGAHVNTVGPKTFGGHELPIAIAERLVLLATDSIEQLTSYREPHFLSESGVWRELRELAELLACKARPASAAEGISLFCSAGLSGTEVIAAAHVLARHRSQAR